MKKLLLSAVSFAVVAVAAMVTAPTTSEAVPSFARQTGAACLSCHFQAIPRLSAFGRNFSMTGMRSMGEQGLIEDDHLSLPAEFNGSFLMKVLLRAADKDPTAAGAWGGPFNIRGANYGIQIPDESAIFVGGRYGEHVGALTEISMNGSGGGGGGPGVAQAKVNYTFDMDGGFIRLDMVTGDVGLGVLFSDPSNTVRHTNRSSLERADALEQTQMMNNSVTGLGISALLADAFYIGVAGYAQAGPLTNPSGGELRLDPYVRAAYIAEVGGLEAIVGGWWTSVRPAIATGTTAAANALTRTAGSAKQYGIDLQLQGDVGDLSVGFYLPIVLKGEQAAAAGAAGAVPVTSVSGYQAMLTVAFGHAGVKLGYDYTKTKTISGAAAADTKLTRPYLGAWYSVAQNVELEIAHTIENNTANTRGDVNQTTLVVEYLY